MIVPAINTVTHVNNRNQRFEEKINIPTAGQVEVALGSISEVRVASLAFVDSLHEDARNLDVNHGAHFILGELRPHCVDLGLAEAHNAGILDHQRRQEDDGRLKVEAQILEDHRIEGADSQGLESFL